MTFFEGLAKPSWIPPDWAFPAAWFTLWILQFAALVLIVLADDRPVRGTAIALLAGQFVFALLWQGVVFGPGRLTLAAWWLVVLWILVAVATVAAWRVRWIAGALVAPTLVWVGVATALGFALRDLNPGA